MRLCQIIDIDPFQWTAVATTLVVGILVGLERQIRRKPVGIRTATLITFGTYLFTAVSISVNTEASDPSRIIGQVVTGVGFLGAGVMLTRDGVVIGVTSAATIWVLAALGVVVAIAPPQIAIKLAVLVVTILYGMELLENFARAVTKRVQKKVRYLSKRD